MSPKVAQAVDFMNGPYSCSQSIMCAFCDEAGMTEDAAAKFAAPYSGGKAIKCGALYAGELVQAPPSVRRLRRRCRHDS